MLGPKLLNPIPRNQNPASSRLKLDDCLIAMLLYDFITIVSLILAAYSDSSVIICIFVLLATIITSVSIVFWLLCCNMLYS